MELRKRLRVLLMGHPGSGKSEQLLNLATQFPDSQVHLFDMEDSIMPLLVVRDEKGEAPPPNLHLYREWPESFADAMTEFKAKCVEVRAAATYGDWIGFDVGHAWWQLSQDAYIERQYGDPSEYREGLISAAMAKSQEEKGRKSYKPLSFGGLVADEWQVVRGDYYHTIPRTLGATCKANVVVSVIERTPMYETKGSEIMFKEALAPQYKKELIKPAGERDLTAQVDMVLRLTHPTEKKWAYRTIGKNRMKVEVEEWTDITGESLWTSLFDMMGWSAEISPGKEVA